MKRTLVLLILLLVGFKALATEYYVSTKGNDKNDGRSEGKAWRTIGHAAKTARSGDIVWIKAGNYGSEIIEIRNSGKKNQPISFIGYKSRPGDINRLYYTYSKGKNPSESEMPLLRGSTRNRNTAIRF